MRPLQRYLREQLALLRADVRLLVDYTLDLDTAMEEFHLFPDDGDWSTKSELQSFDYWEELVAEEVKQAFEVAADDVREAIALTRSAIQDLISSVRYAYDRSNRRTRHRTHLSGFRL